MYSFVNVVLIIIDGDSNFIRLFSWSTSLRFYFGRSYSGDCRYGIRPTGCKRHLFISPAVCGTWYTLITIQLMRVDHTRYFSQMIISFRRMAIDLLASLLFIVVFFTGFFVAFSVTFGIDCSMDRLTSSSTRYLFYADC